MKGIRKIGWFALTLAAIFALGLAGCGDPPPPDIDYTAVADGTATTVTSTKITFTFDSAVTGLTASNIAITNGTGQVTKGALTGSGTTWNLALSAITTPGNITVKITADGITDVVKTVAVYKEGATPPTNYSVAADGTANTTTSTKITFTFESAVTGLTADDITVTNGTGNVTKGALTGSGTTWNLALSAVTAPGNITVKITKDGISAEVKPVTVHQKPPVNYTVVADGAAGTVTSTKITFTFAEAVTGLTASDIYVGAGVTKGALTGSGTTWNLALTEVTTPGNIQVSISKAGIVSTGKVVAVYKNGELPPVEYTVTANGTENTTTTTQLTFTFEEAVTGLTASNIAIGGSSVSKGALSGSGTTWTLAITVTSPGVIQVVIDKTGISSAYKILAVYKQLEASVGENPVSGKTTYVPDHYPLKYVFAANNTYTVYEAEWDNDTYQLVLEDGKYNWVLYEEGTYTWNTDAKTLTFAPTKVMLSEPTGGYSLVEKAGLSDWMNDLLVYMTTVGGMAQEEIDAMLLMQFGTTSIDAVVDMYIGMFYSAQIKNYLEVGGTVILPGELPASTSTALSGKTLTNSYEGSDVASITFNANGTYTANSGAYTGTYSLAESSGPGPGPSSRIYLLPEKIDGKTVAQYYTEASVGAAGEHNYPTDNDYWLVQTANAFGQDTVYSFDLGANTITLYW